MAETLAMSDKIEDALKYFKKICFIMPPLPLGSLNLIKKSELI